MEKPPWSVTAAHTLVAINGSVWLVFALISGLGWLPGLLSTGPIRWLIAALSLGASAVLFILAYYLARRKKWAFYLALVSLGLLGVLSITDEVGALDLFTFLISLAGFLLFVVNREWYLGNEKE